MAYSRRDAATISEGGAAQALLILQRSADPPIVAAVSRNPSRMLPASPGTLPVCTPLPCTYNGPDAVGLQHNCSNVTPLEGTSLRSFGCADCFCNFRHQSSYRGITSASFALKYNMTTAVVNASESGTCFQREGHVSGLAEVHTSSVVFFLASFSSGNRKG